MTTLRSIGFYVSDVVAYFVGSWWFIFAFALFMSLWVAVNTMAFLGAVRFDPYPFILLNLVLSTLAAIQAPFIMISQRRAERKQQESHKQLMVEIKELVELAINEEHTTHAMAGQLKELVEVLIQEGQIVQQIAREVHSVVNPSGPVPGSSHCSATSPPCPPAPEPAGSR